MRIVRAAVTASVLLLAAGCRDDAEKGSPEDRSDEPTHVVVTKADGSEVVFDDITAECATSEEQADAVVLRIQGTAGEMHIVGEIVPEDVEGGSDYTLPIDFGSQVEGVRNLYLFVGAAPNLETSTTEEESSGTLEVVRASCDPVEVELTVDATLGSEYFDGEPIDIEGRLVFPAPAG